MLSARGCKEHNGLMFVLRGLKTRWRVQGAQRSKKSQDPEHNKAKKSQDPEHKKARSLKTRWRVQGAQQGKKVSRLESFRSM
jgi:hypothetical protein